MEVFQGTPLREYSVEYLQSYYRYLVQKDNDHKAVNYNFKVFAEGNKLDEFLRSFERSIKIIQPEFELVKINETSLFRTALPELTSRGVAIVVSDERPVNNREYGQWIEFLSHPSSEIRLICGTRQTLRGHFKDHDDLYYRAFPCEIAFRQITSEDIFEMFKVGMYREGLGLNADFEEGIQAYIQTVYPKADLREAAFLADLRNRVLVEYRKKDRKGILDAECVPYYRKEQDRAEQKTGESAGSAPAQEVPEETRHNEIAVEPAPEEPAPEEPAPVEPEPEVIRIKRYTENNGRPEGKNRKVLVLALSTFPRNLNMGMNDYRDSRDGVRSSGKVEGAYQLEVVPKLLKQKEKLVFDEIIVMTTQDTLETRKKGEDKCPIIIQDDKKTKYMAEDGSGVSELDYFAYFIQNLYGTHETCIKRIDVPDMGKTDEAKKYRQKSIEAINRVLQEIRSLDTPDIYVDIHGGSRLTQQLVTGILYLLKTENIQISADHILTADRDWVGTAGIAFSVFDFVSGINELMNDGKAKGLQEFLDRTKESDEAHKVIKALNDVAEGIQMLDVPGFEEGIGHLQKSIENYHSKKDNQSEYMSLFINKINEDYKNIYEKEVINEIEWAMKKGFYQQALTLIESKIPKYFYDNHVFSCTESAIRAVNNTNSQSRNRQEKINWLFGIPIRIKIKDSFLGNKYDKMEEWEYKILTKEQDRKNPPASEDIIAEVRNADGNGQVSFKIFIDPKFQYILELYIALKDQRNGINHGQGFKTDIHSNNREQSKSLRTGQFKVAVNAFIDNVKRIRKEEARDLYRVDAE